MISLAPPVSFTPRQRRAHGGALGLTLFRLALGPAFAALAYTRTPGAVLSALLVAGFLSDVFDGVVARRAGAVTPFLRRLDSQVDTIFYLGVAWAAWKLHPAALWPMRWAIAALLLFDAVNHLVARRRFGRSQSWHAWSARLWGLMLFLALVILLATGSPVLLPWAIAVGLLSHVETLAITLTLEEWRHDVGSVWKARTRE